MKYLLSILCLFVISCDSGGDGGNNITMDDLNGEWWRSSGCTEYSGDNCDNYHEEIDCQSSEYAYIIIDNGIIQDCRTDTNPECNPNETSTVTLNGYFMTVCADNWEDEDQRCLEGELEIDLNTDVFQWIIYEEINSNCERITTNNAERKD